MAACSERLIVFKKTFIDEVIIYNAEKIEIRFLFDDLIAEMTEKIEREEKEDVAV